MSDCHVYVIAPDNMPITKVGIANDVYDRLTALQSGNPWLLVVRRAVATSRHRARRAEQILLGRFAAERMVGEWLALDWRIVVAGLNDIDINDIPEQLPAEPGSLRDYIERHGVKTAAERLGITERTAASYLSEARFPRLPELARIIEASGGEIDPAMVVRSAAAKDHRSAA